MSTNQEINTFTAINCHTFREGRRTVKTLIITLAFSSLLYFIFLLDGACLASDLESTELVSLLNELRNSIGGGEISVMFTEFETRSMEDIEAARKLMIEDAERQQGTELSEQDRKNLFPVQKREHKFLEEWNLAFEANMGSSNFNMNRYRILGKDRNPLNPLTAEGRYVHAGYCRIITYDGELSAVERDSPFLDSFIALNTEPPPVLPFHLFGRSLREVSAKFPINLTWKTENAETLCEIQYSFKTKTAEGIEPRICKLLINPSLGFAVLKEKHFAKSNLIFSIAYSKFSEKHSIFYPADVEIKWYSPTGKIKRAVKIEVIDTIFNVNFPPDFFSVTRIHHPGQSISPFSEIKPNQQQVNEKSELLTRQPGLNKSRLQPMASLEMCGPLSLQFICEQFGINADIAELLTITDYKEDIGTSMKGLNEAAQAIGLNSEGILIKSKSLVNVSLPAIAYFDHNHFIVIKAVSEKGVVVFDPSSEREDIPLEEFERRWTGHLLTFAPNRGAYLPKSESYSASPEEPRIQVPEAVYDFGQVRGGQRVEHVFTIENVGNASLEIAETRSSCGCATSLLSEPKIPPGGNIQVKVHFTAPMKSGKTEQYIEYQTNDLNQPLVELRIKAEVYLPLEVSPKKIYLGKISHDTAVTRIVRLDYAPQYVEVLGIGASSNNIHVQLLDDKHRLAIRVHPKDIGWVNEKISIDYVNHDEKLALRIPVKGQVIGDFEISSSNIFFGSINANTRERDLSREVIITASNPDLVALRVENQSDWFSTELVPHQKRGKYNVRITAHPINQQLGLLKETIRVYTNSTLQNKLQIMVYAQIVKNNQMRKSQ